VARPCARWNDECLRMINRLIELSLRNRFIVVVLYLGLDDQHWNIVPDGATWPKVLILTEDMATPTMLLEAYGFGTTMDPEEEDE